MTPDGKYELTDVEFKEMSEDDAVRVFTEDGYFQYSKRTQRYSKLPSDGIFATSPSTHFVLFEKDTGKPLGVVGYSQYKNILLGAGIHAREDMRGKGIASLLANMTYKTDFTDPLGVFYAIDMPTYEDLIVDQINDAIKKKPKGSVQQLLDSGDNWVVK